jgi:c(7)-type cytochrome triheme protein
LSGHAHKWSPPARRARARLAIAACCAAASLALTGLAGRRGATADAGPRAPAASFAVAPRGETDFSKFSHASQRHASLACASCHARAADNSAQPRLPGHKACTGCHLPQFVTPNSPLCFVCHDGVEGENPAVKNFPPIRSFAARFDHAQHGAGAARPKEGCAACHRPAASRPAALTIPAGFAAHSNCYSCHTPDARSAGRDIAACGTCHTASASFFRTPALAPAFRVGFSHAAHGARQRLSCADCHRARAGLPQSRQVSAPLAAEHFRSERAQSCLTCHDNRRAFGDASFRDCSRCHKGQTFRRGG